MIGLPAARAARAVHVTGEDVRLDVDPVARDEGSEHRRGEGLGDQRHLEPVVARLADGAHREGDAVHGDRALPHHEGREGGVEAEAQDAPRVLRVDGEHGRGAVDVTLHEVAAEAVAERGGAFEVDAIADPDAAQRRHVDRDAHDIRGEPVGPLVDDREAHAVHGDRVAVRRVGHRDRRPHGQPTRVARALPGEHLAELFDDAGEHLRPPSP
jgi:hypothetical protein